MVFVWTLGLDRASDRAEGGRHHSHHQWLQLGPESWWHLTVSHCGWHFLYSYTRTVWDIIQVITQITHTANIYTLFLFFYPRSHFLPIPCRIVCTTGESREEKSGHVSVEVSGAGRKGLSTQTFSYQVSESNNGLSSTLMFSVCW